MIHELRIPTAGDDDRLNRLVGFFVRGIERKYLAPYPLRRLGIVSAAMPTCQTLEDRHAALDSNSPCDLFQGQNPSFVIKGDLGNTLERAPAPERLWVELASLEQCPHGADDIGPRFAPRCNLRPTLRARS